MGGLRSAKHEPLPESCLDVILLAFHLFARVRMRSLIVLLTVAGVACATQPAPTSDTDLQVAAAPDVACPLTNLPGSEMPWRLVQADGFTFCVPPSWEPTSRPRNGMGSRNWRMRGGKLAWGTGVHRERIVETTTVIVEAGRPITPPVPSMQVNNFRERIGGRQAELYDNYRRGVHYTGASWTFPQIWLTGEARDRATADLQLAVYRTVRFTGE